MRGCAFYQVPPNPLNLLVMMGRTGGAAYRDANGFVLVDPEALPFGRTIDLYAGDPVRRRAAAEAAEYRLFPIAQYGRMFRWRGPVLIAAQRHVAPGRNFQLQNRADGDPAMRVNACCSRRGFRFGATVHFSQEFREHTPDLVIQREEVTQTSRAGRGRPRADRFPRSGG